MTWPRCDAVLPASITCGYAPEMDRNPVCNRETGALIEQLTQREYDVLQSLAEGLSDRDIARRGYISMPTVRTHITSILGKLGAESRLQALVTALRHGIVTINRA